MSGCTYVLAPTEFCGAYVVVPKAREMDHYPACCADICPMIHPELFQDGEKPEARK